MRFVDTTIFVKWGQATLNEALSSDHISLCGYILAKIRDGEEALTSSLVKSSYGFLDIKPPALTISSVAS